VPNPSPDEYIGYEAKYRSGFPAPVSMKLLYYLILGGQSQGSIGKRAGKRE